MTKKTNKKPPQRIKTLHIIGFRAGFNIFQHLFQLIVFGFTAIN